MPKGVYIHNCKRELNPNWKDRKKSFKTEEEYRKDIANAESRN